MDLCLRVTDGSICCLPRRGRGGRACGFAGREARVCRRGGVGLACGLPATYCGAVLSGTWWGFTSPGVRRCCERVSVFIHFKLHRTRSLPPPLPSHVLPPPITPRPTASIPFRPRSTFIHPPNTALLPLPLPTPGGSATSSRKNS